MWAMDKTKSLSEITAENIIEWRKKRGYTSQKLADLAGVSRQTIHNIEHLITPTPSIETVMNIADALNVPLDFLVKDDLSAKVKAAYDLIKLYDRQLVAEAPKSYKIKKKKTA